jgi:hypothetical protein
MPISFHVDEEAHATKHLAARDPVAKLLRGLSSLFKAPAIRDSRSLGSEVRPIDGLAIPERAGRHICLPLAQRDHN